MNGILFRNAVDAARFPGAEKHAAKHEALVEDSHGQLGAEPFHLVGGRCQLDGGPFAFHGVEGEGRAGVAKVGGHGAVEGQPDVGVRRLVAGDGPFDQLLAVGNQGDEGFGIHAPAVEDAEETGKDGVDRGNRREDLVCSLGGVTDIQRRLVDEELLGDGLQDALHRRDGEGDNDCGQQMRDHGGGFTEEREEEC